MGIRILIIDDVPAITLLISQFLTDHGYEVIEASNGQEALELMELTPVSLIISDIMMPKMGGFEFIEKCRRFYPKVPIIMISAKQDNYTRTLVTELGANGFLAKPINIDVLSKLVTSTLAAHLKEPLSPALDIDSNQGYIRVPFFCEADFQSDNLTGITIITSISRSGCNLEIQSAIPVGTVLSIQIKLQPGYTIDTTGTVCYSIANAGVGVRFNNLDENSAKLIDSIVKTISKLELFDLEYRDHKGKLIDTFVDKFEEANKKDKLAERNCE